MLENYHLRVPNFSQIHTVTMTHLFWGWCHLKTTSTKKKSYSENIAQFLWLKYKLN